ncbi:unnamed protein product [Fraxinus pennsylvanica]|uniref:EF-hand domain-containing protein n=1 Tax=Fraxinus pennsylvanica TaxID=56036 RepID=A0AAD2A8T8_9LAMI|nr:unnamed protein product [Fraxinus pennsylvanica]
MAMRIHCLPYVIQIFTATIASLSIMVFISFISSVHGRILRINSSDYLISDGIDDQSSAVTANDVLVSASTCQHTYGFLPCAENAGGYIFQILVYQGLLIFGEMQLSIGSKVFFKILENRFGTGKYVSIIFRILMGLPAMMMMIITGVFGSKENAQSLVSLGVGIYAGITVFTLTLQWGICLILGAKKPEDKSKTSEHSESTTESETSEHSESQTSCCLQVKEKFNELKETSVKLRNETRKVAGIMLLSLIPYIIVQLVDIFNTSHIGLLIAFVVSAASLLSYFIYQTLDEWMQKLSSDYMQYEILREAFLKHVERWGTLIDEDDGNPNFALIKILFGETDKDGDGYITGPEMKKLFNKIMPGMSEEAINRAVDKSMELFDSDNDSKINQTEFTRACVTLAEKGDFFSTELQDEASFLIHANFKTIHTNGSILCKFYLQDVASINNFQQFSRMEKEKLEIDPIMSKILKHAESQLLEGPLIQEDGKPNIERINILFRKYDNDNNKKISRNELEQIINTVQFENLHPKSEDVVNKIFFNFDKDGSNMIEKEEFVNGLQNWLGKAIRVAKCSDKTKSVDKFDKIVWDKFVYGHTFWNFVKCVFRIVLGIVILTFIGGPLTTSILELSYAMSVPSFSISFVIVPLAMNARTLIEAIFPIYSSVVMNNISGLTILLAVVYAKDLPWDYSAEVLTILVNFEQFSQMEKEKLEIDPIMSKFLKHAESQHLEGSLIQEDGKPNIERINTLFRKYDNDNNNKISRNELEQIINTVQFENLHPKSEDVVNKIFFNFDKDGSNMIEKEEFVNGLQNWLGKAIRVAKCSDKTKSVDKFDKIVWDKFVYGHSFWNFVKCVFRIVLGIVILTFIGGPLTTSILQLSYAMSVPSFSISFVIVPLAMNARTLIEAIFPIYSSVVMNNISGLTILLAVVYAKDLPWDYSAEVLTILVVCAVIGILGCSSTSYPYWTCLLAFFLYPFSLALYCFVHIILHWN